MAFFKRSAVFFHTVIPAVALLLIVAAGVFPVFAEDWAVSKVEGHEYVAIESIKKFYGFRTATKTGNNIVLSSLDEKTGVGIVMNLQIGSQECLINRVKFILTNNIESGGTLGMMSRMDLSKLIDPVLRPNFIPNAANFTTVILDAGHGGKDPGATNTLGAEAAYNLALAMRVKKLLESKEKHGAFKVILTRDSDHYYSLQERVEIANAVKEEAIFISLHFNSGGRDARGIETFTLSPPGVAHYGSEFKSSDDLVRKGNEHDSANIALATAVHGMILKILRDTTFDRGIKRARFSVLSGVCHPAILFEGGFMSHPYEARLIATEAYQNAIALGIESAVLRYQNAVTRRVSAKPEP